MFYKGERTHILISVVSLFLAFYVLLLRMGVKNPILPSLTIVIGFVLHELGHKLTAMKFGCIAVYRAWLEGLVLALALALFSPFIFAAPGAVYIYKPGLTIKEDGIISLAGPMTNILLAFLFLFLFLGTPLQVLAVWGFKVNFFLAAFNMLPIPPLDGSKVFRWNIPIWAAVFLTSAYFGFLT